MAKKKSSKKVASKGPKIEYIVTWDESGGSDPLKKFKSLEEAKTFVTFLFTKPDECYNNYDVDPSDVDMNTVAMYKAEFIGKPIVTVAFTD